MNILSDERKYVMIFSQTSDCCEKYYGELTFAKQFYRSPNSYRIYDIIPSTHEEITEQYCNIAVQSRYSKAIFEYNKIYDDSSYAYSANRQKSAVSSIVSITLPRRRSICEIDAAELVHYPTRVIRPGIQTGYGRCGGPHVRA